MPRIFDNLKAEDRLLEGLKITLEGSYRADFCVGYFNLRGWSSIAEYVDNWIPEEDGQCRVLVGMHQSPHREFRLSMQRSNERIDQATAQRLRKRLAQEFRDQLIIGTPTNADEVALQKLADQLRKKQVVVKLFLRHKLHAKLYLLYRQDPVAPIVGYLGSSNLTMAGLSGQGELNIDVLDKDAREKLAKWFEDRWKDNFCIDISEDLVQIIEESWAREEPLPPYQIYVKMAYHLAQEARAGLSEFQIPKDFEGKLFEYQKAAVQIAAHHLNRRGGVLIGDVVGLGKTFMATALARVFEDDYGLETLIICPRNLVDMWEDYCAEYRLRGKVLSITRVINELPETRRYRLVIIDESHNLRNREGKRYRAILDYLQKNESKCILLSATPYNKTYLDLSNQLRLFLAEDQKLGIRPERLLEQLGGQAEFMRRHQADVHTLAAFEKSEHTDDWRELMRLFMVRRTRTFIQQNYAHLSDEGRRYLEMPDGTRSYFPVRIPQTLKFKIDDNDPHDQYAQFYSIDVVNKINNLSLPRYGLGNYTLKNAEKLANDKEKEMLGNLSRAGSRLIGFSRTNLFKRLESSGHVFVQSLERHILRNYIFLHAIDNDLPLPIGTQDIALLDIKQMDEDTLGLFADEDEADSDDLQNDSDNMRTEIDFQNYAKEIYQQYERRYKRRFKWLRSELFDKQLARDLKKDADALLDILEQCGDWDPNQDEKLNLLIDLLTRRHPDEKVLIFTQFADTVDYLVEELKANDIEDIEGATGSHHDPTSLAYRFSPVSNGKRVDSELRVLVATDVLSEGQNLQDAAIVVNYDLPWAIIRLIQRAGRVDRIGQQADQILCYLFLPAEGIERIITLRTRLKNRLAENREVVGTDEAFFEDDVDEQILLNLYNERAGILDDEDDVEVDLSSYAYQIWQNAVQRDPTLERKIPALPLVRYATRPHIPNPVEPEGVLVYMKTEEGVDSLAWIAPDGESVTESQFTILNMARCEPDTPALRRAEDHHGLVEKGVILMHERQKEAGGGQLGRPSGARYRTYDRLKAFATAQQGTLFEKAYRERGLYKAIEEIYQYPLRQVATDTLNRQLRSGIGDDDLAELVINLRDDGRLCIISDEEDTELRQPQIICSMGLLDASEGE